jgi:shikimate dehydrogenase
VFLGAGGAARATGIYFGLNGARSITVANRTFERAAALAADICRAAPECSATAVDLADDAMLAAQLRQADVLVQATSLGLHGGDPAPVDARVLPTRLAVMDMIYRQTPLLRAAAAAGMRCADGRGMLLHQGVRSFELWTGRQAPVEIMRSALYEALAERERAASPKDA